ncbi:LOW QUALITY PROTEIN: translation initiation factor eIF-2B subunit delta [Manduca sexta]|uniref:LOW QUALITY PROTEIN: translation initiation factor eIF-2B subunit delta n=1 Tax=Manduca sexta TaxID=7130 RepID=UPI0018903F61|nr:LOW QUALITY PROTEIN: translation initiation factor eIF-2B subunit delta [Manduca sexta]
MSSKGITEKSRDEVLGAREAKKLAKQKAKQKAAANEVKEPAPEKAVVDENKNEQPVRLEPKIAANEDIQMKTLDKSKDEVDRAVVVNEITGDNERDKIKAERAAKKAAKQAKKKGAAEGDVKQPPERPPVQQEATSSSSEQITRTEACKGDDMTVRDVVETLKDIANVAKEVKEVTAKVQSIDLGGKKAEEAGKSKAELRAERRAKQEAQRAAKQAAEQKAKPKEDAAAKPDVEKKVKEVKPVKVKVVDKPKVKSQVAHRINWCQHLCTEHDKESLRKIAINSNLHPAIVKLGVQLASRVVTGSNARCIALLDALKKMVIDYIVPAKTEFARGLESYLATSLDFLWSMRQPSASQTNAVKAFRHHIMQLPNNVDEFDAKKKLQEEIDRYIREQIETAGQAISIAVRNKISDGDNILTYGCSSLIERILVEAWEAGVRFRTVVVGNRVHRAGPEMLRRLTAKGLPCTYVDFTGLHFVMSTMKLCVLGCDALLADGSVRGALGTAGAALAARAVNVPVLVAAETHKFSEHLQTDALVHNELGDPDDLIDKNDENSPLKDWRSNPNLTPLNLTYDITPPSLVTAVVTELAILPCTSAPVVLRFKLSEYGM